MGKDDEAKGDYLSAVALMEALDRAAEPPQTPEQAQEWVEPRREYERSLHEPSDPRAELAALRITTEEILAIVRSRKFREQPREWIPVPRRGRGPVHEPGVVRVARDAKALLLPSATVQEFGLDEYSTVALRRHATEAGRARFIFYRGGLGDRRLSKPAQGMSRSVGCQALLAFLEVTPGSLYTMRPAWTKTPCNEYEIDFRKEAK